MFIPYATPMTLWLFSAQRLYAPQDPKSIVQRLYAPESKKKTWAEKEVLAGMGHGETSGRRNVMMFNVCCCNSCLPHEY